MVTKPDSATVGAGKFLQTDANGQPVWDDPASPATIGEAVTEWLEDNVSGGSTIAVDSSLSIQGAGADAKAAGDAIAAKADNANPVFTGSVNMGRCAGSTVGTDSTALGGNVTASGTYSHGEGNYTYAEGAYSHAEGYNTVASGSSAHAEGHSTRADGFQSHAEGFHTKALGGYTHASGAYNQNTLLPDWVSGTSYEIGDRVQRNLNGYECVEANSDTAFTSSKWTQLPTNSEELFMVGNGMSDGARSNAMAVT